MEAQYANFLDMIKEVRINVPLVDVLAGMPNYGKFLKDLVRNKSKMEQISAAFLTEECSSILQNKIPSKLGDLESFLIPYKLANSVKYLTLADLGASINLMSYSLDATLFETTLKPTRMSIRLANHTYQYPMRVAENMLVQVRKFVFPVDFVILQIEEDDRVPLILAISFLHTADAIIRVKNKELNLGIEEDRATFHIDKAMQHSHIIETPLDEEFDEFTSGNVQADEVKDDFEELPSKNELRIRTSIQDLPTDLEMKHLLKHLEYAFLEENSLFPEKTTFTFPYGTYTYKHMPFGLFNAPATFHRCMIAIFQDMLETSMEVFMDDFLMFGDSFDSCLNNLKQMLIRCKQAHLVLNWEKCHFMVTEGIMLGHKVSRKGLEEDKAKIDVIAKLPPPTNVKAVRSFLGHARFYRRFIKYFSKISRPMMKLLKKDSVFNFDEECNKAFKTLKDKLMNAPIMVSPNWSLPFELMCDASDFAVGAVLGQLFALDKFRSYLVLSKTDVFTDHAAIKNLFSKQDAKPRLIRWILLLQEFDIKIKNKKGAKNVAADHLSRLKKPNLKELKDEEISDEFPNEFLMSIKDEEERPWFADFANYLVGGILRKGLTYAQHCKLFSELKHYFWDELCNPDLKVTGEKRFLQLHELDELRLQAYENSKLYKAQTKAYNYKKLRVRKEFKAGDKVLMYNSKYKFKAPKLISKWYGLFIVKHGYPSGYVELYDKHGGNFIVNGHRVKLYQDEEQLNELSIE
nr:reverse transcriptase domain-containing protein [Tanacetum cinerariifolium]